jgi:methyltransferase (TIGR00027 family)
MSCTAEYMALFRAVESSRPGARLFTDPWALSLLSERLGWIVRAAELTGGTSWLERMIDWRYPGALSSGIARTRRIDELVLSAVEAGATQLVLLGAGFDMRARRLPALAGLAVFELDRREVLDQKRLRLGERDLPNENRRLVAADLGRERLSQVLVGRGFDRERESCFVWEGVTNYLSADGVDATLREIACLLRPGGRLVFTYVDRRALDPGPRMRRLLEKSGETWTFGLDPGEVEGYLEERGFSLVSDEAAPEYRARYPERFPKPRRGYEFYHLVFAERRS